MEGSPSDYQKFILVGPLLNSTCHRHGQFWYGVIAAANHWTVLNTGIIQILRIWLSACTDHGVGPTVNDMGEKQRTNVRCK